jgi:hypothetical protein
MSLNVFTRTTNMKNLLSKVILLVEMKALRRTRRNQSMDVWYILKAYYTLELNYDNSFKVIKVVKANTCNLQDMV